MIVLIAALFISLFLSPAHASPPEQNDTVLDERCRLKPEPEPCKAFFQMYYYNPEAGRCVFFGGCSGVVPFQKLEECRAACETPSSKNRTSLSTAEIGKEEYAVLETVLKEHVRIPGWYVKEATIKMQLSEKTVAFLNRPHMPGEEGMRLDPSMVRDFNDKNREVHALSQDFIAEKNAVMYRSSGRIRTLSLSRAAFDAEQKRAVVFLRDSDRLPPEVFMQSDYFILLERSGDTWTVIKKIQTSMKYS